MTKNDHSPIEFELITPGFLLQPVVQLVPFPFYTSVWHDCLLKMEEFEENFLNLKNGTDFTVSSLETLRNLKENKVRTLVKVIPLLLPQMSTDAIVLVARVVKDLMEDPWTSVVTAWSLFNPMAEALGPVETLKIFNGPLTSLFDSELPCTIKHLKLYHRSFLLQVFVRIGTKEFLDSFVLPLIEAVAGERDKLYMDENEYSRHLIGHQNVQNGQIIFRKQSRLRKEINSSYSDFRNSQQEQQQDHIQHNSKQEHQSNRGSLRTSTAPVSIEQPQETDPVQFDLDISDDGIQICADDGVSMVSSESQLEDEELVETPSIVEPTVSSNMPLVSEVAKESLMWMVHRLGPLLTSKYLTRNLLRMLALCYYDEKLTEVDDGGPFPCNVSGDACSSRVLSCLEHVAAIYGEQFIVRHYFTHCSDMVQLAGKRLNPNVEACLIACVVVVRHMFPFLTNEHLMDNLKDHYFVDNIMYPVVRLVSSLRICFSSRRSREVLVWKLLDCLFCLGVRAGGENVKNYLFVVLQRLMCTYDVLYELDTDSGGVRARFGPDGDDSVIVQLREIFGPRLASLAFVYFGQLVGR